jgi:hypothetical protein
MEGRRAAHGAAARARNRSDQCTYATSGGAVVGRAVVGGAVYGGAGRWWAVGRWAVQKYIHNTMTLSSSFQFKMPIPVLNWL